jgi:hypothetical protein
LAKDVQALVVKWYFEETEVNPNKKDILCHQVGIKNWETHVAHFLQKSETSCFSNLECILFMFWTLNFVLCNVYITFNVQSLHLFNLLVLRLGTRNDVNTILRQVNNVLNIGIH